MKRTIYLDLDGVFADFEKRVIELFGKPPNSIDQTIFWKELGKFDHFWKDLDLMSGSRMLYDAVMKIPNVHVAFLTAIPRPTGKLSTAADDKKIWVKEHFGTTCQVYTVVGGVNKAKFIQTPNDILIDDTQKNIDAWNKAGGIGILHTGTDYYSTIFRLMAVLNTNKI
jgi:5'(3')-deoxyribonucleotidase